jgi:hypothetical protein
VLQEFGAATAALTRRNWGARRYLKCPSKKPTEFEQADRRTTQIPKFLVLEESSKPARQYRKLAWAKRELETERNGVQIDSWGTHDERGERKGERLTGREATERETHLAALANS